MKTELIRWEQNSLVWMECKHFVPRFTCWVRMNDGRELVATYEDGGYLDERGNVLNTDDVIEWQPRTIESIHI